MSDGVKKYILISSSILLILLTIGICFLWKQSWVMVLIVSYISGIANGIIINGIVNWDD